MVIMMSGAKTVRVHINAGRKDRMAPNFILGALVEATGMAGNEFGNTDIHDQYTTVEVPETETDFVIDAMQDEKINGKAVSVAALTADVAAETAASTASPDTAITSTHAAAAITASGERADIAQQG